MNDISLTEKGEAYAARHQLHLPAEMAMALALALSDPRVDIDHKRIAAELAIDDLIAFLDDTDGDPDLEPSLGFGGPDDREGGDVLDEPHDEIDEDGRDMSWPEGGPRPSHTSWMSEDDEISEHDEDDGTAEPSLAAPEIPPMIVVHAGARIGWAQVQGNQERWARGSTSDGENNVEDEGEATNEDGGDIQDEPHDEEPDCCAADEMSPAGLMSGGQKAFAIAEGQRLLAKLTRQPRRDPDELTIVGPGVGRIGAW